MKIEQMKFNVTVAITICGILYTAANWEYVELGTIQTMIAMKAFVIFGFTPVGVILTYFYFKRLAVEDDNRPEIQKGYQTITKQEKAAEATKPLQEATPIEIIVTAEPEIKITKTQAEFLRQLFESNQQNQKSA